MVMLTRTDFRAESPYRWTANPYWAPPIQYASPQPHFMSPLQRYPSSQFGEKDYARRPHHPAVVSNSTRHQRPSSDHPTRFSEHHRLSSPMSHSHHRFSSPPLATMDMYAMSNPADYIARRPVMSKHRQSVQAESRSHESTHRMSSPQLLIRRKPVPGAFEQPRRRLERHSVEKRQPGISWNAVCTPPQSALRYPYGQRASNLRSPLATLSTSSLSSTTSSTYSSNSPSRSPTLTAATSLSSSSSTPSCSSSSSPAGDTQKQRANNSPVCVVKPCATRSMELRPRKMDQDKETRRHSMSDSSPLCSAPIVPPSQAIAKPSREAKTRRVTSANPYVTEKPEDEQASVFSKETLDHSSLTRNPTFWNPRTSLSSFGTSSVSNIAPIGRNLSRRLRGLLQPHRALVDSATKDQHAADRAWSVDRPMTPKVNHREGKAKPDPFRILSNTLSIVDKEENVATGQLKIKERDFELIDTYAASVQQRGPMLTPQVLAQKFLARPYQCELQKLRAIYMWVIQNIDIRQDSTHGENMSESAEQVLGYRQSQTAAGISKLFCHMVKSAGIEECQVVSGYLRAPKDSIDAVMRANGQLTENHAWCMVKVKGEYRFVDCWLASPFMTANKDKQEPHWFLTKPSDMIYTHFPSKPFHQCLSPVVSSNTFFALPCVYTPFFRHKMRILQFDPSTIELVDDEVCHITVRVNKNIQCYAEVETRGGLDRGTVVMQRALAQCLVVDMEGRSERVCKIKAVLPPGQVMGWLKIYAGPCSRTPPNILLDQNEQPEKPPLAMCFRLTHRGKSSPFEFVQIMPSPNEFYVHEPQCHQLFPLQSYNFHIQGVQQNHHKLAVKSPRGRLYKLMYYPQDHTYVGNVTTSEVGKWSLICLLHQAGGWSVIANWECRE